MAEQNSPSPEGSENWHPTEAFEADGQNAGKIKDVELAQSLAESEEKIRYPKGLNRIFSEMDHETMIIIDRLAGKFFPDIEPRTFEETREERAKDFINGILYRELLDRAMEKKVKDNAKTKAYTSWNALRDATLEVDQAIEEATHARREQSNIRNKEKAEAFREAA
ncbi:MAG: hypothetical protein WCP14_00300 [bacterium]